ncbi:MAG: hypothetical protein V8R16_08095 [Bacilli bacterium]
MRKLKKYYLPIINLQKVEIEDILSASNVKTDEILDITTGIDENL